MHDLRRDEPVVALQVQVRVDVMSDITAEQIIEAFPRTRPDHAERIAAYIGFRRDGQSTHEAVGRLGLTGQVDVNAHRYEKWFKAIAEKFGLSYEPHEWVRWDFSHDDLARANAHAAKRRAAS